MTDYLKESNRITRNLLGKGFGNYGPKEKPERQPIGMSQKKVILKRQNYRCAKCGRPLHMSVHFDHIKPVSKRGKSTTDNLRALCPTCHSDRHIEDKAKELDKKRLKGKKQQVNPLGNFKLPKYKIPGF